MAPKLCGWSRVVATPSCAVAMCHLWPAPFSSFSVHPLLLSECQARIHFRHRNFEMFSAQNVALWKWWCSIRMWYIVIEMCVWYIIIETFNFVGYSYENHVTKHDTRWYRTGTSCCRELMNPRKSMWNPKQRLDCPGANSYLQLHIDGFLMDPHAYALMQTLRDNRDLGLSPWHTQVLSDLVHSGWFSHPGVAQVYPLS